MIHCNFTHFCQVMRWLEDKGASVCINITPDKNCLDGSNQATSRLTNNGIYIANILGSFTVINGNLDELLNVVSKTPDKMDLMNKLINGILLTSELN